MTFEKFTVKDCKYRVSIYGWVLMGNSVNIKDRDLSFSHYLLLFCETKNTQNKFSIALLVCERQGDFEILSVWGTPRISVMVKAIEMV